MSFNGKPKASAGSGMVRLSAAPADAFGLPLNEDGHTLRTIQGWNMKTPVLLLFVLGTLGPSLLAALLSAYVVRRFAPAWGLVDKPGTRKVHTTPTPLGGGIAIWLGVVLPLAVGHLLLWLIQREWLPDFLPEFARPHVSGFLEKAPALWSLLGAGTVLMVLGLLDDRRGLRWQVRLAVECGVAAVCVTWLGCRLTAFLDVPLVTWVLSVLWIVALVNSFNMLDNMDGLSAGVAAIAGGLLATVLLTSPATGYGPQLFVGGFLLVLVGSLAGFLWHNRPVAKLFMGDAGSYFVGFSIAVATLLATFSNYEAKSQHAILAPLCVLAVPLYDMATVLWIRLREGRSPFHADKSHFSHRLVERGLTKGQAVLTIYLTTATCGLGALLLYQVNTVGAAIVLLLVVFVLTLIAILESTGRK